MSFKNALYVFVLLLILSSIFACDSTNSSLTLSNSTITNNSNIPESESTSTGSSTANKQLIDETKWKNAIDSITNKDFDSISKYTSDNCSRLLSNSNARSKDISSNLILTADKGFKLHTVKYDYKGENRVEFDNIVTPVWYSQNIKNAKNFILFDDLYRDYSYPITVFIPAYIVGYQVGDKFYCSAKEINDANKARDPQSIYGTWNYIDKEDGLQKIWKSSLDTSSMFDDLTKLLSKIKDSYGDVYYNQVTDAYELNGYVYMEKDTFENVKDEVITKNYVTFNQLPESAKISRPLKLTVKFDENNNISSVSTLLQNPTNDDFYLLMQALYGNSTFDIEYINNVEYEIEGMPSDALEDIL